MPMPSAKINCDIRQTDSIKALAHDAGVTIVLLYLNGSIPAEVVLTVKQSSKAFVAATVEQAISAAGEEVYGGL